MSRSAFTPCFASSSFTVRSRNFRATFSVLLAVFMLAAASAHAQTTYTVTNTNSSGTGSLAAAVASVDADTGTPGDTIDFASGVTGTITLGSTLTLSHNVTITGPGANLLTVSGNNQHQVFAIGLGVTASISGLTIAKGNSPGNGGGIYSQGTLTVSNSTISGNTANDGSGGSFSVGGGIYNNSGTLTVSNSTFSGNTASGTYGGNGIGGGIYNYGGTLTVSNSTFNGNTASGTYGGVGYGGGIAIANGSTATITNSIVAGNTTTGNSGDDCYQCGTQSTYNLISTSAAPITAAQLMLGPLQYNGGPTETMMPLTGSPALNAGLSSTLATDQRDSPGPRVAAWSAILAPWKSALSS